MRVSRRFVRWLSGWLVLVLLTAQFGTAAYACTKGLPQPAPATAHDCTGTMPGSGDTETPLLCQAHCQQGSQTGHPTPATDAPLQAVLLAVLDWRPVALQPARCVAGRPPVPSGAAPPGAPPRYLSLLVLRN